MRRVKVSLSAKGIDSAVKQLETYKCELSRKTDAFRKRVVSAIAEKAQERYDRSVVDNVLEYGSHKAEVTVTSLNDGGTSYVIARGEDAVWVEFGAGVTYNGSVGSSPNPWGNQLGFTIGSYGTGRGRQSIWYFRDDTGKVVRTYGTRAESPLYRATEEVMSDIEDIVKEVFR